MRVTRLLRRRNEQGAYAIIFAITIFLILGLASLAVDLGNAYAHKRNTQNQADFSALAASIDWSSANINKSGTPAPSDPMVIRAACVLSQNLTQGQSTANTALPLDCYSATLSAATAATFPITPAMLTDNNLSNGETCYGEFQSGSCQGQVGEFTVLTPGANVQFGLAGVMGYSSTTVTSSATVGVGTPGGQGVMPYYAFQGCDYGPAIISQPATGSVPPPGLNLANSSDNFNATLNALQVTPPYTTQVLQSNQLDPDDPTYANEGLVVTIDTGSVSSVTKVGFFQSVPTGTTPPAPVTIPVPTPGGSVNTSTGAITIPSSAITTATGPAQDPTKVRVDPPGQNPVQPWVWYVRVYNGKQWSPVLNKGNLAAQPLFIGPVQGSVWCQQGGSTGNFGAIAVDPTGTDPATGMPCASGTGSSGDVAQNLAVGLCGGQLGPFPSPSSPWTCTPGSGGAIGWASTEPPTNCVDTQTGQTVTVDAITWGLLTGQNTAAGVGRLVGPTIRTTDPAPGIGEPTSKLCPWKSSDYSTYYLNGTNYPINNDVLTCFFTPDFVAKGGTTSAGVSTPAEVGDFDYKNYSGGPVLDDEIYCSPRFFWVPVFGVTPTTGGSNEWQIVAFRGAFVTDQSDAAGYTTTPTTYNGLNPDSTKPNKANHLTSVQVVFFNNKALPSSNSCGSPMAHWLGSDAPKIPLLTN